MFILLNTGDGGVVLNIDAIKAVKKAGQLNVVLLALPDRTEEIYVQESPAEFFRLPTIAGS